MEERGISHIRNIQPSINRETRDNFEDIWKDANKQGKLTEAIDKMFRNTLNIMDEAVDYHEG